MKTAYVSATYEDLRESREAVSRSLRRLGVHDVAMESYVAEARRPLERSLDEVRNSDLYIGIFAWRYGYIPPGYDKSITELEFDAATAAGKPRLIFLLSEDATWPVRMIDRVGDRIDALRDRLSSELVCSFFSNPDELGAQVAQAVARFAKEEPPPRTDDLSGEARDRYFENIRRHYARIDLATITPAYVVEEFDVGLMSAFVEPAVYRDGEQTR